MHDAVMTEFGGSLVDDIVDMRDRIVTPDPDMSSRKTWDAIELEDFQSPRQSTGITET